MRIVHQLGGFEGPIDGGGDESVEGDAGDDEHGLPPAELLHQPLRQRSEQERTDPRTAHRQAWIGAEASVMRQEQQVLVNGLKRLKTA